MDLKNSSLGLIAGYGDLPKAIIQKCKQQEQPIFVAAIIDQTPVETVEGVDHIWLKIGHLGKFIEAFQSRNIKYIMFAGGIKRPNFNHLTLDWEGIKLVGKISYKTLGDDGLLTVITTFLQSKGFEVVSPIEILQDLTPLKGTLTIASPTDEDQEDIKKGIHILDLLSPADIGQAIVIQMGQVLGIEAIEGTAKLIDRIKNYKLAEHGGVLVKMSKTHQNLKIDLPTIGPDTIHQIYASHLKGIAIEANRSQILHQTEVIRLANEFGLFIHVFNKKELIGHS